MRRAVNRIGEDLFPYYLEVQQADMLAQSDYRRTEKQERLDKVKEAYETIINEHQCVSSSIVKPNCALKRTARMIRSASSENAPAGFPHSG